MKDQYIRYIRRGLSLCAALMVIGAFAGCSGGGTESGGPNGSDASSNRVVELPAIEVKNHTLKILGHDADGMEDRCSAELLEEYYGITDVQITAVPPAEKRTRLLNAVMSQDSFDIYWDDFAPTLISGGYVVPIEVDMSLALWDEVSASNEQYMWSGKRYYVVPGFARQSCVYYNKSMFDEAGETYPTELFDKGEWDWNKMLELAETLTIDSNRDGTPEQYGLANEEQEHILYTTGKHFVTFMPDGTARNNIQSPEVARAVAYNQKLIQSGTLVPANGRQVFGEGGAAMCVGHRWFAFGYADLVKTNDLGVAPLPRDPDADKYFTEEDGAGFYIPKYAPNPEGALAAANAMTYYMRSEDYKRLGIEERLEDGTWTMELQEDFEKSSQIDAGVVRNWEAFGMGDYFGDIWSRPASGEPWETIAAELAPKIDAKIKELYETK